jgi:integrase/ribosomal protein L40E
MSAETSSWLDEFLRDAERRGLSKQTLRTYQMVLGRIDRSINLASCADKELLMFLDSLRQQISPDTYHLNVVLVKMMLTRLKREDLAERIPLPKRPDKAESIKRKVLPPEDVAKLIHEAPTLQDRLIFELLNETGGRRAEINHLCLRNIQFETIKTKDGHQKDTAILWLTGKSGTRTVRVYNSVPDLRNQINNHPLQSNPNAPLIHQPNGKPYADVTFWFHVKELGLKILGRRIHPHMFRHTKATRDSKHFTDREMMLRFGWKHPEMVSIYSHLSMRDVDEHDLILHGLKPPEEADSSPVEVRICGSCEAENAPVAIYCHKCGNIISSQTARTELSEEEMINRIVASPRFVRLIVELIKRAPEPSSASTSQSQNL